jgi:hypothetical protein
MGAISSSAIRYIKLGQGDRWADVSLERGEIHFGWRVVPHDMCVRGDWGAVQKIALENSKSAGAATRLKREVQNFYTLDEHCLWIAFVAGRMWWSFAKQEVFWLGAKDEHQGARMRKTVDGWHDADIAGNPLRIDQLSSKLTQVMSFQGTVCEVTVPDYVLRKINAEEEPMIAESRQIRSDLAALAFKLIQNLHWADFEAMVDLIFARSGWQRIGEVGGSQKDFDIMLEQGATGEKAFVQIKSKANQGDLNRSLESFRARAVWDHCFFVCHSPNGPLAFGPDKKIHLWTGQALGNAAIRAGLFDWLVEKSR